MEATNRSDLDYLCHDDLRTLLAFTNLWLECVNEAAFYNAIRDFAAFLGFEFTLCAFMRAAYDRSHQVHLVNLSNPAGWMQEYQTRGFLEHDPVRIEMERRLHRDEDCQTIVWDAYERDVSPVEREIIERRTAWGLRHGFSVFCNSRSKESVFLASFASATRRPDDRALLLGRMVLPHVNRCRRRLDLLSRVGGLTARELAVVDWLIQGKTNWEIATILEVSERTVKFHVGNLLKKLQAANRQHAVSILIAARYLS